MIYFDDRVQINVADSDPSLSHSEYELKIHKFKGPAFLKKLTNTYFKKSRKEDIKELKKRIHDLKKKYRSKQSNMSFNLEQYMNDKMKKSKQNQKKYQE